MEGTSSEIATHAMQESFHQSQTIVEREEDEDVRVIEEPLKQRRVLKTSKGKMGKTVAEVEEERGVQQEGSQQSQKRIEREDEEDLKILEEPVKKKTTLKKPRGKMLKMEDEDEEDTRARWKDEDIEMLIALRGEMDDDFKKNSKKQRVDMWHKLHARLLAHIPTLKKSHVAIKKKFNNLFKAYKEDKLANNVSGESRHECKYYDQFESWFSQTGSVHKHVSASANDSDLHVEDSVDDMDLDDSLDNTKKKTSTMRASGKTKFHDEALVLFGEMVETSKGLLKSFNHTTDVLNNQLDKLIDKL